MVNTTKTLPILFAAALFALQGCQFIGGIEERSLVASDAGTDAPTEDVAPDVEPDVPVSTECDLPEGGNATMRIGNFVPTFANVDFCIKPTGQPWESFQPVLAGGGGGCPRGLSYRSVSASFGVQAGVYDVIAVEDKKTGARPDCSAAPVAEATQVVVNEGDTVDALLFGDALAGSILRTFDESRPLGVNDFALRFVHGMLGANTLDCGVAGSDDLPTEIVMPAFASVAFASFAPPGQTEVGRVDENGYIHLQIPGGSLTFAAAISGNAEALLTKPERYNQGSSYSLIAIGRMGDKQFPPEMIVCDESRTDGIYTRCGGLPLTLTVDSANLQLAGAWGPFDKERAPAIQSAIAQLPSDVVCVHEAWGKAIRGGIVTAAASKFPHSATFDYDFDSVVDDPTDQNGNVPPEYTEGACAQSEAKLPPALDCIRDNCVDPLASEDGIPVAGFSDCATKKCTGAMLPLLGGSDDDKACWSCMFSSFAAWENIGFVRDQCVNNPKARYAHRGDSAVVVLSKHPIQNAESWLLPATEWRVNIVRAPITLPNGATVDVYCTQLTTPADNITRPYMGQYGNGETGGAAWREELLLQSKKLIAYVQQKSESVRRKAIIVGSFYTGPEYFDGQTKVLEEVNVETYNTLAGAFPLAVPQNYMPVCTLCNDNLILAPPGSNPKGASTWQSFVFLSGMPLTAVESANRFWTEPALTVTTPETGEYDIPLSTHYGFRSVIRVLK